MNPAVEYRRCPRLESDRHLVGKDGTLWEKRASGKWVQKKTSKEKVCRTLYVYVAYRRFSLASLVLEAFGIPQPPKSETFYKDGDRSNCALSNLAWAPKGTNSVGVRPSSDKGRFVAGHTSVLKGSDNPNAVLTKDLVAEARMLYRSGWGISELAREVGVSAMTMVDALRGRTWKDVPNPVVLRGQFNADHRILDEQSVVLARQLYRAGARTIDLAERFSVDEGTMGDALRGRTWKHVPGAITGPANPVDSSVRIVRAPELLDEQSVSLARQLYRAGARAIDLAERFSVSKSTMKDALRGRTWKHVPGAITSLARRATPAADRAAVRTRRPRPVPVKPPTVPSS
ncbi:MAG: hypothetical protein ACHRXM_33840 [Isosphaerales bacterium]